jgi:transposase
MTMKNKYIRRSKISEVKFREILKYFAADLTAKQIANFTKININTINRILKLLRQKIAQHCEKQAKLAGDIEADESYFGPKKSGRGAPSLIY